MTMIYLLKTRLDVYTWYIFLKTWSPKTVKNSRRYITR